MAQKVTVQFFRSLYKTYAYIRGNPPTENPDAEPIDELLRSVNNATGRGRGHFFTTLDGGMFVAGFIKRPERGAVFDLYATQVSNLEGVDLQTLLEELRVLNDQVHSRGAEINNIESVTLTKELPDSNDPRVEDAPSEFTEEPATDFGLDQVGDWDSSTQQTPPDDTQPNSNEHRAGGDWCEHVAEMWEHYRLGGEPLRTNLEELTFFCRHVSNALEHFSYVSRFEHQVDYFNAVGEGSRSPTDENSHLVEHVRENTVENRIAWDNLPTYYDDLRAKVETQRDQLKETVRWEDSLEKNVDELYQNLQKIILQKHVQEVADVYTDVLTSPPNARTRDNGILTQVRDSIDFRGKKGLAAVSQQMNDQHLTDEERDRMVERLVDEMVDETTEEVEQYLREQFFPTLEEKIEAEARQATLQTAEQVNEIRDSKSYAEAGDRLRETDQEQSR